MTDGAPTPAIVLTIYCVLVVGASLAGGWVLLAVRLTHTRLQVAISFVAGLMLGVGLLHMLPHAYHQLHSVDRTAWWMLAGFLVVFFIQRFLHFHHHDVAEDDPEGCDGHNHDEHGHSHSHSEPLHHDHTLAGKSARHLSWTGAALGLTLHTLIDGVALAASVEAEAHAGAHGWLLGLGTFLVVFLHKPFDALAIGALMAAGGWSRAARHWVNGLFALANPVGVLLFFVGISQLGGLYGTAVGSAVAFAAGSFLCIAASDLLPELQFHSHDRVKLSIALLAGLGLAALLGVVETSGHDHHEFGEPAAAVAPATPHSP